MISEPIATYADFIGPGCHLGQGVSDRGRKSTRQAGNESMTTVTLRNTSPSIAFFTRVQVLTPSGDEVLPVIWDDNYISILPGATKTVTATYATNLGSGNVTVKVGGSNVMPTQL